MTPPWACVSPGAQQQRGCGTGSQGSRFAGSHPRSSPCGACRARGHPVQFGVPGSHLGRNRDVTASLVGGGALVPAASSASPRDRARCRSPPAMTSRTARGMLAEPSRCDADRSTLCMPSAAPSGRAPVGLRTTLREPSRAPPSSVRNWRFDLTISPNTVARIEAMGSADRVDPSGLPLPCCRIGRAACASFLRKLLQLSSNALSLNKEAPVSRAAVQNNEGPGAPEPSP
jgi:hypothetical protein